MVCILTIMLQNGYKQHFQWNAISKLLCYGDTNIKAYPRYSRLSCSSRNWMQCSLHCYCADEYLHPHLHSKAIISLKLNALHSKWVSRWTTCAVTTRHQHKRSCCSDLRADFFHQCFNQTTIQEACLMASMAFEVCDRYSTQTYRALFHCFIPLYIISTSVKLLLSIYDSSCMNIV